MCFFTAPVQVLPSPSLLYKVPKYAFAFGIFKPTYIVNNFSTLEGALELSKSPPAFNSNITEELSYVRLLVNEIEKNGPRLLGGNKEVMTVISQGITADKLTDVLVYNLKLDLVSKMKYLRTPDTTLRIKYLLEDVKKEVSYIGPFKKMNINLNDLSNQLRQKYYNYAYIGVRKVAGTIYIDIQISDEFESNDNKLNMPCDILSNVDGKVIGFEIQKGIPVVNINQIIKKGDLIITGNINYQTDPSNLSNLIHSEGVVLIEYAQYEKISVLKKYLFAYNIVKKFKCQ